MKRLLILLLLPILGLHMSSCKEVKDKINEVSTTVITTDFVIPLQVVDRQKDRIELPFSGSASYVIPGNEDLKDHLKQITKMEVLGLVIRVSKASPNGLVLKSGLFGIKDKNGTDTFTFSTPANFPLETDSEHVTSVNDTDYTVLNNIINDLGNIELNGNGVLLYNIRDPKLSFEFVIKVQATINANL